MSDYKYLGRNFKTFTPVKPFAPYSRVVINIDDDTAVSAGNDSGYTLQIECPWGTQAMAENILRSLAGKSYQPFQAKDAQLDPAVELGDTLGIAGVRGVLYQQSTKLTAGALSQIAAPGEQEINHEYPYKSPATRKFTRQTKALRADINLLSGQISLEVENRINAFSDLSTRMDLTDREISAKVSQTGGDNASFGWNMDIARHAWYADGSLVMEVKRGGLKVEGEIIAKSGKIGDCLIENGVLKIASANIDSINAEKITAGYLSVDRIESASLTGSKLAAATITGGSGGNIGGSTLTTWNTASGINTNLGYAAGYGMAIVQGTSNYPGVFNCGTLYAKTGITVTGSGGASFSANMTLLNAKKFSITGQSTLEILSGSFFNFSGYGVTWKSLRLVTDIIGGVADYATIYYLGR